MIAMFSSSLLLAQRSATLYPGSIKSGTFPKNVVPHAFLPIFDQLAAA